VSYSIVFALSLANLKLLLPFGLLLIEDANIRNYEAIFSSTPDKKAVYSGVQDNILYRNAPLPSCIEI